MSSIFNQLKNIFVSNPPIAKTSIQDLSSQISSTKTPMLIDTLIEGFNPAEFMSRKGFKVIDKMIKDEHINGILELKKFFILSTGYHFILEDAENGSEEVLNFINNNFNSKYKGLLTRDLHQILTSFEYGFSISEKIYSKIGDKLFLTRIKTVPPHSIDFKTDDNGELIEITQQQFKGQISLPLNKILLFSQNQYFDNPYGKSDLERCYRSWFAKDTIIKFWTIYLQRFASPFPVGKVPDTFGQEKVDEMIDILDSIQQAVSLVIPEGASIELHKVGGNTNGEYDTAIERFNQMIARALLLPDLMGMGQSTTGGSYSLGQKQYEMFVATIEFIRKSLEELINEEVIKQLVDINFGVQDNYPVFRFKPFKDEALTDMIKLFLDAFQKGMPTTTEDFDYFRKLINFPVLNTDIDQIQIKKETPQNNDPIRNYSFSKEDRFIPNRKPSKYEARIDFVKEAKDLDIIENNTINNLASLMKSSKDALKSTIIKKEIIKNADIAEVNKLQLKNKGEMKRVLQLGLNDIYSYAVSGAKNEVKELTKRQNFAKAKITDLQVTNKQAQKLAEELIDTQSFQSIGTISDELLNKTKQKVISGIQLGKNEREIMQDIDIIFNEVTQGSAKNNMAINPSRLQVIVRTNATNINNLARKQVASDPDIKGFVWAMEYSAILDDRTTDICQSLDGKIIPIDSPEIDYVSPPLHFNCRSQLRYVTQIDRQEDSLTPSKIASREALSDKFPESKDFV